MDTKITYWGSVIFSTVALILIIVNISLSNENRAAQQEVSKRQAELSGAQTLSQLNQSLVQALAEAAHKNNNVQLRDLLATQNITLKNESAAATKPDSKSTAEKTKK